ncbi:protein SCAI-like isoform X2 [Telopea speciosissima]|uniref:protein SCAI-like isoform X2 n=1 Tax=Telopea speciosissima TaxID=54955 RepID=UPI001CC58A1B|nr:protein SCAI-like isoform X2 [Telopea speciosissima]
MSDTSEVAKTFRALVESADRKFTRVRDVPSYGRGHNHYFHKVFKSYTRLWKFQQENRSKLVESGLQRWEIGEIASRIGQLYYGQYLRTSEARFLLESYIFYAAIFDRSYFQGPKGVAKDLNLRYKELRFYARFLIVSLLLNRSEMVQTLVERFKALVDDSKATFRETNFKEWKQVVQEIVRFLKADIAFINARPLRYCAMFDSHPTSFPYVARFHAKRVLKLKDALLMSYHGNEVKFVELTLDTFRMLQCLEWEPSGSFFQKRPVELTNNGASDQSGASGLIDINLAMDMTDPTLAPNPKKTILYRPSVTNLISVLATLCEELPPESILLLYISASGKAGQSPQMESSKAPRIPSNMKVVSQTSRDHYYSLSGVPNHEKGDSSDYYQNSLWLGPRGSNNLYPGDIIPFTRKPLFLIIDSDNSHAFKVVHSAERGETTALLLSPARPVCRSLAGADLTQNGSQFTYFLSCPLQAFLQLVGLSPSDTDVDMYSKADNVLSTAFSEWEVILCKSTSLDLVWAQVLSDSFLRRLILRFIFCRSVLSLFCYTEDNEHCLPDCLPCLPDSVSSRSEAVQRCVLQLAHTLGVADCFQSKLS